jgi:hypothetical protein
MISNFGELSTTQGAMDGAAIGTAILPGPGTVIGAIAGGVIGHFDKALTGDKDMWKTEGNRWDELSEQGVEAPDRLPFYQDQHGNVVGPTADDLGHGIDVEDTVRKGYAEDFQGFDEYGTWVNNKFASSRSEADLRPQDIMEYAVFYENIEGYGELNSYQKYLIAKHALENGLVDEHHGSLDFTDAAPVNEFAGTVIGDSELSNLDPQSAQDRWVEEEGYDPKAVASGQAGLNQAVADANGQGKPSGGSLDSVLASIAARSAAMSAQAREAQALQARRDKAFSTINAMQSNVNRVESQIRGSPISVATGKQDLDALLNGILQ